MPPKPVPKEGDQLTAFLYVDDTTLFDSVPLSDATRHYTTNTTVETFSSLALERAFVNLGDRAEAIGMRINAKKTQLLVISPRNGCITSATINPGGSGDIHGVDHMKLVGFTFGSDPGVGAHVESIEEHYKRRKWMLYHLKGAGIRGKQLYRLYCCYVRSSIEYCSPVYHALLNGGQEEQLERLQRQAIRVCFGCRVPVEETMQADGIQTLKERRIRRCDAFINKARNNPRFSQEWFPRREEIPWELRRRRDYQETQAATLRRHNSPLAFMRRRLNEIDVGAVPE